MSAWTQAVLNQPIALADAEMLLAAKLWANVPMMAWTVRSSPV
jgi:hypothetical protein